jgi:S-(hydroxymethyl)glutathione dehydrogenase/alcohol dehydrogenase
LPTEARAAVLRAFRCPQEIRQVSLRAPADGEVLVRISAAGICHSDVGQADGEWDFPLPAVLGHEGAGVVEAVGPGVCGVSPGDFVILSLAPGCGTCRHCLSGRPIRCQRSLAAMAEGRLTTGPSPISADGEPVAAYSLLACFADRAVVAEASVVPVSPDVPAAVAALIGCAVITGAGAVLETVKVAAGSRGMVIGAGGVGVSAIMGAVLAGADEIVAVDPAAGRRARASEFGATATIDAGDARQIGELRRDAPTSGFDWSVVTTGQPEPIALGIEVIRPGGTACIVGLAGQKSPVPVDMLDLVTYERTVTGSAYGSVSPMLFIPRLVEFYRAGRLPLDRLISDQYPLDDINAAFARSREAAGLRSVLHIAASRAP